MNTTPLIKAMRDIPDFPEPGIVFKDITPILNSAELFKLSVDLMIEKLNGFKPDKIIAIDARGFIFGSAMAYNLGCGVVPVRKAGKLPWTTISQSYSLEYGQNILETHIDAVQPDEKVIIVDDLLATGGTAFATAQLINQLGAKVISFNFLVELAFLEGREKLDMYEINSLITVCD